MIEIIQQEGVSPLFSSSAISSHLIELGYPEKSLNSMLRCGQNTAEKIIAECPECGISLIDLKHRCNLRTCPTCSKIRKNRVRKAYLPILRACKEGRKNFLYFLTISPPNYMCSLEEALQNIHDSFSKFVRLNYIKERIKGGLYVIEVKDKGFLGLNVHIHCIVYGRWLDNRIRGKCLECGQNLIKFDYNCKKYYCASKKCNSRNVVFHQNSKLVSLWTSSTKQPVNIHISRQNSCFFTLNYMLKYISSNKEDFPDALSMAKYIIATRKRKLINTFGFFFKQKRQKYPVHCFECGSILSFIYDRTAVDLLLKKTPPPDPSLISTYLAS